MDDCPHGMPTPKACLECMEDGNLETKANEPERRDAPVIKAQFEQICEACEEPIEADDELVHTTKGRWVHEHCCPA